MKEPLTEFQREFMRTMLADMRKYLMTEKSLEELVRCRVERITENIMTLRRELGE